MWIFFLMFSNGMTVVTPGLTEEQCEYAQQVTQAMYQSFRFRDELPSAARTKCIPPHVDPPKDSLLPYKLDDKK